jgi:hemerythrin superfamily protein
MVGVIALFRVRRREAPAQADNHLTQPRVGELSHFTREEIMSKQATMTVEPSTDLLNVLKEDHQTVKELFERFEQTADAEERAEIIKTAINELEVHAELEEKIVYPALRAHLEEDDLINEALEEHHVVHLLIKELKGARGNTGRRDAKFTVLVENVKHHIKEEEECLFPESLVLDLDWESLSAKVEKKKAQLISQKEPPKRKR